MAQRPRSHHISAEGTTIATTLSTYRRPIGIRRILSAMLIAVCGWLAFTIFGQVIHGANLNARVQLLNQQNAALRLQINDHQKEISQAESPAWLEEQARKLGYVLPGEKVFVVGAPDQSGAAGGGVTAALPTFAPSPSPSAGPASPGASPGTAGPTPFAFTLSSPAPSH